MLVLISFDFFVKGKTLVQIQSIKKVTTILMNEKCGKACRKDRQNCRASLFPEIHIQIGSSSNSRRQLFPSSDHLRMETKLIWYEFVFESKTH